MLEKTPETIYFVDVITSAFKKTLLPITNCHDEEISLPSLTMPTLVSRTPQLALLPSSDFNYAEFRQRLKPRYISLSDDESKPETMINFFHSAIDWTGILGKDDGNPLGVGSYGVVFLGKWLNAPNTLPTPPPVAIKVLNRSLVGREDDRVIRVSTALLSL